ncbi:MAG: hypothetical protein ACK422_11515, partial [Burkholderiales bacterium]
MFIRTSKGVVSVVLPASSVLTKRNMNEPFALSVRFLKKFSVRQFLLTALTSTQSPILLSPVWSNKAI